MEQDQGLTSRQARRLLEQHGENSVKAHKKSGALKVFAGQFRDGLIMILLAATVLSVLMGETGEALTIIARTHYSHCFFKCGTGIPPGVPYRTNLGKA